jgi:hypothetical protein
MSVRMIMTITKFHNLDVSLHDPKATIMSLFENHHCENCDDLVTVFSIVKSKVARNMICQRRIRKCKLNNLKLSEETVISAQRDAATNAHVLFSVNNLPDHANCSHMSKKKRHGSAVICFPSSPPDERLIHDIVNDFCSKSSPEKIEESGCAVCGLLTPWFKLSRLKSVK